LAILALQFWRFSAPRQNEVLSRDVEASLESAYQSIKSSGVPAVRKNTSEWQSVSAVIQRFNPNQLDVEGFMTHGLSRRQAESVLRYRSACGGYRSKEDVKKIRVLDQRLYAIWEPFIDLPERITRKQYPSEIKPERSKQQRSIVLDLNRADTNDLKDLPLIGSGRARAIVRYRERLGGYVSLEQLSEIRILPDSVIEAIKPFLRVESPVYRKLMINSAPADSLYHPYCPRSLARMIVAYREQHGVYTALTDLSVLPLADAEILRKIAPYISFEFP